MDEKILLAINQGWANPGLDILFAWISQDMMFSTPLLMILLGLFGWRFGRDGIKFWLLMVLFIALGDFLGSIFKDIAAQPRPCAELGETVRRVVTVFSINCSHNPSGMPSNHALNFFLMASFTGIVLRWRAWVIGFVTLAILVALSRVYLGVHYPSQILVGSIIGSALGCGAGFASIRYLPFVKHVYLSAGNYSIKNG